MFLTILIKALKKIQILEAKPDLREGICVD